MMFSKLKTLLRRAGADLPEDRTMRGLPVTLINTRPDIDSEDVFERLDTALGLIEQYQASHFRRLHRDFARIQVRRFPCRGAYFPETRTCLVELTFVVNRDFTPTQVAATILHEAMHARLDTALGLIEQYQASHFRRLHRDFARIQVRRFPCRGAYFPEKRTCLVELTFVVNRDFTPTQVAATILHEAMHARLDNAGVRYDPAGGAKHERFCRRAEVEFGMIAPDGAPVVERALASLASSDEDVAPVIDWELAGRRVGEADLAALSAPTWMKRAIARRAGIDNAATREPNDESGPPAAP